MKRQLCGLLKLPRMLKYNSPEFRAEVLSVAISNYLKANTMSDKLRLFQYAAILHVKSTDDKGKVEWGAELILDPKTVLAKTEREVVFKATREIPEDKASDPDNVEIIVRPF